MKNLLKTLKGKLIFGGISVVIVAMIVVLIMILSGSKDYRTIKVAYLNGQTIITDGDNVSQDAYEGMNLESGDKVFVQVDSDMTLLFDMDKYMFADAGTKFWVEASGSSENGTTKTRIHLEEGSVLCRIDNKLGDDEVYDVETPNSVMSVRGTIFRMSTYKDESGENYTRVDVLEGAVQADLYKEDGTQTNTESKIEAGTSALVHSNQEVSEFVEGENEIRYEDYSESMSQFIVSTMETGREICVDEETFIDATGLSIPSENKVSEDVQGKEEKEHILGDWTIQKEATCIEKGTEIRSCTECGEVVETRELEMTTHVFDEWSMDTAATCAEEGLETRTCTVCGEVESREIEVTSHSYGAWKNTKSATCTEPGIKTRSCSMCGKEETINTVALGHVFEHTADCTHQKENTLETYKVGDVINVHVYINCSICNATGGDIDTTVTVVTTHPDYPNFCEYKCSCGHVGTY